jgi:hypothetical protein
LRRLDQQEEDKVMKRLMMLLGAGVLVFGAATQSASASTFDLGTIDPGTTSGLVVNLGVPAPVSFEDTINFSLAALQNSLIGTLTDIPAVFVPTDSLNFSLDLFSATDPLTSLGNFTDATGTVLAFSYLNLAAGDYFFRIAGEVGDDVFGNAYSYRFEVSEVPLPPALLLFATALGGMAVASYRRRKKGGAQA